VFSVVDIEDWEKGCTTKDTKSTKGFLRGLGVLFLVCFVFFVVIIKPWERIHHEVHEEHEGVFCTG